MSDLDYRECDECEAASIEWANNGGDWFYRETMKRDLHNGLIGRAHR